MQIVKFEEKHLTKIKERIYLSFSDTINIKYLHSYSRQIPSIFSSETDRKKLYDFFDAPEGIPFYDKKNGFWDEYARKKLNLIILNLIVEHSESFIRDIHLNKIAKYFVGIKKIEKLNQPSKEVTLNFFKSTPDIYTLITEDNHVSNFLLAHKFNNSNHIITPNFEYLLDSNYLKKTILEGKQSKSQFYIKDILAILFKIIKNTNLKHNEIDIKNFFNSKTKEFESSTKKYLDTAKDIIENKTYYRKRKEIDYHRLNQKTFVHFFSYYAKNHLIKSNQNYYKKFFETITKNNLRNNDFKPDFLKRDKFQDLIINYSLYARCIIPSSTAKIYKGDYALHYNNYETYRNNLKTYIKEHPEERISSHSISPKKYTYKTKQMLNKRLIDIEAISRSYIDREFNNINISNNKALFNFIIEIIDNMKTLEVSEKTIRGFIEKYINFENHINIKNNTIIYNRITVHDSIETTLFALSKLLKKLLNNFSNPSLLNSFIHLLSNYNLDSQSSNKVYLYINSFNEHFEYLKDITPFKSLKEFNIILSKIETKKNIEKIKKIKKIFNITPEDISWEIASKMNVKSSQFLLLSNIMDNTGNLKLFNQKPLFEDIEIIENKFTTSILSHKNSIGLLGANARGVCIPSYGKKRLSQINPNFINLTVYNKDSVMIWGLLCRAINDEGKIYYILNNLQGSIPNNIDKHLVLKNIKYVLSKLIHDTNIENILYLDLGFNAISLDKSYSVNTDKKKIKLNKKIRLDFSLTKDNYIVGDFYCVKSFE